MRSSYAVAGQGSAGLQGLCQDAYGRKQGERSWEAVWVAGLQG